MCNKKSEQAKLTQIWVNRQKSQILYLFMYIRGPRKAVGIVGKRRSKEAGEGFFIKKAGAKFALLRHGFHVRNRCTCAKGAP